MQIGQHVIVPRHCNPAVLSIQSDIAVLHEQTSGAQIKYTFWTSRSETLLTRKKKKV